MLGLVETITTAIVDHFPSLKSQMPWVIVATCGSGMLFGLIFCTSGGIEVITLLDNCTGSGWLVLFVAIVEVVLVSWIYGVDKIFDHIEEMEIHIPYYMKWYWRICWKYLTPGMFYRYLD